MVIGVFIERSAGHVGEPLNEREAGRGGHRIEFVRWRPSDGPGPKANAARLGQFDELPRRALFVGSMIRHRQDHAIGGHRSDAHIATGGCARIRNDRLDHERTAGAKSFGHRPEALLLVCLLYTSPSPRD